MAIFSKQHYEAITKVLNETWWNNPGYVAAGDIVSAIGEMLKADNPKFNAQKFIDAVLKNNT